MEANCIHSIVECSLKNKIINVPTEYISICRDARKRPCPYDAVDLNCDFLKKFNDTQFYKNICSGHRKGGSKV